MKKYPIFYFGVGGLFFLFLFIHPFYLYAQSSVIGMALKSQESIVKVSAIVFKKSSLATFAINRSNAAGVIIDPTGIIVTNIHTIKDADKIAVTLFDGKIVNAKVIRLLPKHDIALIKVTLPLPLRAIKFADSNSAQLGETIINIGSSNLLKETISEGIIIGLGTSAAKKNQKQTDIEMIEINMNLYKGDSGGPVFNKEGELLGMIVAKNRLEDRVSYAIASNKIKVLYLDYMK